MRKTMWKIIFTFLFSAFYLNAAELYGKVIKVSDGDTVNVLTVEKETIRIRLLDIDAPEKKQAFGNKSRENLANYIAGENVKVEFKNKDRYGRVLGTIYLNDLNVNLQQIKDGFAWVYRKYSNKKEYLKHEMLARNNNLGLWSDKEPIEPWNFRKMRK